MPHPYTAWVRAVLPPFAEAALAQPTHMLHLSWCAPQSSLEGAHTHWGILTPTHFLPRVLPGKPIPPTIPLSAHRRIELARMAPAFWEGLDTHMAAFNAPFLNQAYTWDLYVHPTFHRRPSRSGTRTSLPSTTRCPFPPTPTEKRHRPA